MKTRDIIVCVGYTALILFMSLFLLIIANKASADTATIDANGQAVVVPETKETTVIIDRTNQDSGTMMCQPFGKGSLCTTF